MPGECHAHVIMDGENYKKAVSLHKDGVDESVIRRCFLNYQRAGITFIRDGGDSLGVSRRAAQLAPEYGILYRTPLFAIHKAGHYGGIVGKSFETLKEYHRLVQQVKVQGGDFIKIMVSGLIDFSSFGHLTEEGLEPALIREMVRIAHEEGMAVMAHCNGARTMEAAACAGVDSIEHGAYSDKNALEAMAQNGVIWTPTVSPIGNLKGRKRFADEVTERIKEHHLNSVRAYAMLGGRIALGSDAGAFGVFHAEGVRTELAYLSFAVDAEHLEITEKIVREKFQRTDKAVYI